MCVHYVGYLWDTIHSIHRDTECLFSAQRIAPLLPFQVVYLSQVCVYTKPISSRHIISNWQPARSAQTPESCPMPTVDESGHRPSRTETYWCAFVACMIYILYRFNFVDVIENRMIFSVHHLLRVFFMICFYCVKFDYVMYNYIFKPWLFAHFWADMDSLESVWPDFWVIEMGPIFQSPERCKLRRWVLNIFIPILRLCVHIYIWYVIDSHIYTIFCLGNRMQNIKKSGCGDPEWKMDTLGTDYRWNLEHPRAAEFYWGAETPKLGRQRCFFFFRNSPWKVIRWYLPS